MSNALQQSPQYATEWLRSYSAITVVGLGVTGLSVARFLLGLGLSIRVQDSRANPPGADELAELAHQHVDAATVTTIFGAFDEASLAASDLLVVSPGVALSTPAVQTAIDAGVEVIGDIDILVQSMRVPVIAITGSNGKSTVTELVGAICRTAGLTTFVGGNIGLPALSMLADGRDYAVAVLELSSFQLETTRRLAASSAVILNISQDHLDRYASMGDYIQAKLRVFLGAQHVVANRNDKLMQQVLPAVPAVSYGLDKPQSNNEFGLLDDKSGLTWLAQGQQKIVPLKKIKLAGQHNVINVLAAMALVVPFAIPAALQAKAIEQFTGLPHRMQVVRLMDGVTWINDSKATNVGAAQAALLGIDAPIVLLAGGQGKGGDFSELLPAMRNKVKQVLLFGEDAEQIAQVWQVAAPCQHVSSLAEAVSAAQQVAEPKDVVLLAPACASFDMFSGYEQRGEQFMHLVNAL